MAKKAVCFPIDAFLFLVFFSPWPRSLFSVCNLNWSPVLVTNVQLVGSTFESTNKKKKKGIEY